MTTRVHIGQSQFVWRGIWDELTKGFKFGKRSELLETRAVIQASGDPVARDTAPCRVSAALFWPTAPRASYRPTHTLRVGAPAHPSERRYSFSAYRYVGRDERAFRATDSCSWWKPRRDNCGKSCGLTHRATLSLVAPRWCTDRMHRRARLRENTIAPRRCVFDQPAPPISSCHATRSHPPATLPNAIICAKIQRFFLDSSQGIKDRQ